MTTAATKQRTLSDEQIEHFREAGLRGFVRDQVADFRKLTGGVALSGQKATVDIGGGCGYFADALRRETGLPVRVIDTDRKSVDVCRQLNVDGEVGDALSPVRRGDEGVVCFNLILHHLVADTEAETLRLQKGALLAWRGHADYVFVNEYAYESYVPGFSGRLIFEITGSKVLSALASLVGRFVPSLRANTFGVGVRFRSHGEWERIFRACGFEVVGETRGAHERVHPARRALLIKSATRDSFLLRARP